MKLFADFENLLKRNHNASSLSVYAYQYSNGNLIYGCPVSDITDIVNELEIERQTIVKEIAHKSEKDAYGCRFTTRIEAKNIRYYFVIDSNYTEAFSADAKDICTYISQICERLVRL